MGRAWAQQHPSRLPSQASQIRCHLNVQQSQTFGDDVVAAAMIDRLVHHSEVLTLSGDSYRTHGRRDLITQTEKK